MTTPIQTLTQHIQAHLDSKGTSDVVLVGIHTGGVWVANAINEQLETKLSMGTLNISFYRDDFTRVGLHPNVKASDIQFDIENKTVILVDDVLYTGRTIRAAMNELFDFGRPSNVLLAVLISRDGQELPIKADFVGEHITLSPDEHIEVSESPIDYQVKRHEAKQ